MNTIKQIVLSTLVLAVLIPGVAAAQGGPWHFAIEAGLADPNRDIFDEALQIQGSVGYDVLRSSWGVLTGELAVGTSVSEGDINLPRRFPPRLRDGAEWDVTTAGLFLTYRTDEVVFYPLARVGFQHAEASTNRPGLFPRLDDSDSGLAAGIGAGLRFSREAAVELSWTRQFSFLNEDLDIIALGVRF